MLFERERVFSFVLHPLGRFSLVRTTLLLMCNSFTGTLCRGLQQNPASVSVLCLSHSHEIPIGPAKVPNWAAETARPCCRANLWPGFYSSCWSLPPSSTYRPRNPILAGKLRRDASEIKSVTCKVIFHLHPLDFFVSASSIPHCSPIQLNGYS